MADNTNTVKIWQEAAAETKDCLPLEVLEQMMDNTSRDAKAAAHLAGCAHCQTELAMLKSFEQSTPTAEEGAAVAWIAAQLERQQNASVAQQKIAKVPFWRAMFRVPYLAGAAALAAVLILGVSLYHGSSDGPSKINPGIGSGPFRGAIHLVSPIADQNNTPAEFRWEAVQGASSYRIELKDVAGITLATAKSAQNVLQVTPEMKTNMISGKPLKWTVTAMNADGKEIANSSTEQFKIR
ncbi:MAG TPA: hypothetical protein VHW72_10745 [Candidatus Angelobacter sp.]|jgi:hypothetical protein|nr:hypothetical protein [Candidatus Angelobacter sp.]